MLTFVVYTYLLFSQGNAIFFISVSYCLLLWEGQSRASNRVIFNSERFFTFKDIMFNL